MVTFAIRTFVGLGQLNIRAILGSSGKPCPQSLLTRKRMYVWRRV